MNILVTGGAGYVGSTLVRELLARGDNVRVFDNLAFGVDPLLPCFRYSGFDLTKGDIRDGHALKEAVKGMDAIVHLAAIVGYPACDRSPEQAEAVNLKGTELLDLVRGDRPVVFASTGSVYGKLETMCDEDSIPNPLTTYGRTKLAAERVLLKGGNAVVYRFATAFGLSPRMRLDLLPNTFTYEAVKNRSLVVYEGHFRRTFIHVSDMARAFIHALERFETMQGQVYNCGSNGLNATKRELAEMVARHVEGFQPHYIENGHDPDARDYEVDYGRLNSTGFQVQVGLEEGICEMVRAFQHLRVPNPYSNVGV